MTKFGLILAKKAIFEFSLKKRNRNFSTLQTRLSAKNVTAGRALVNQKVHRITVDRPKKGDGGKNVSGND